MCGNGKSYVKYQVSHEEIVRVGPLAQLVEC